jgi:hypothetical protein
MTRRHATAAPRGDRVAAAVTDPRTVLAQRPYRWRGVPGWDPAQSQVQPPQERYCATCGAAAGERCVNPAGKRRNPHEGR